MLKMDGCNANITEMPMGYGKVAQAINSTGRPIVFSCSWPAYWNGAGKTVSILLAYLETISLYVLRLITVLLLERAISGETIMTFK